MEIFLVVSLKKEPTQMPPIRPQLRKYFKGFSYHSDIIMACIYMKVRFSLSYRDVEELARMRGLGADHSTIGRWVMRFIPLLELEFRRRKKAVNGSWRMDETYIKLNGKWVYLYRAVDKYGDTIDFLLRAKRDALAAKAFFRKAMKQHGKPDKVNIDKSGANKAALDDINQAYIPDERIEICQNKYLNNRIEGDHRFIKKRTRPMLGFKSFTSAKITIAGIEMVHMIKKGQLINNNNNNNSTFAQFVSLVA
jgi:putative transposase